MKVAIMLSGMNRSKLNYYINHKQLIDKYNADVYISTYNTDKEDGYLSLQEMMDLYTPKKIEIEKFDNIKPELDLMSNNIQWRDYNTLSMFYKIQKTFDLIEKKYDVYIRMRFDNTFDKYIIEENDFLNIPIQAGHGGFCDQFAFGNYDIMKEYCHMYDKIPEYLKTGQDFHPETIVKNLNKHLNIKKHDMIFYLNLDLQKI